MCGLRKARGGVGNVAGISEDAVDSDSGFIVDPTSTDDMSGAIITLLGNEELRKEMGKKERQAVEDKCNWRKVAEQVSEVCLGVIKEKG